MKNGYIDADFIEGRPRRTDRERLIRLWMKFKAEDRPHLICCGAIDRVDTREFQQRRASENHDLWFEAPVVNLQPSRQPHFFCARVIREFDLPRQILIA